jgi:hypothetical protein
MTSSEHQARGVARVVRRMARRAAAILTECNYAQRRLTQLRLSPDSYMRGEDHAPGTYAEFLFRTSSGLRHEPSAHERTAARHCRR